MTVGDVNSNERGSGARFNDGKPPLHLIPAGVLALWEAATCGGEDVLEDTDFLDQLASWQQRETAAWELLKFVSLQDLEEAAFVLEYGSKKYAAWNWAKGMDWSVPVGCILRHHLTPYAVDDESGRLHWGHVVCNIIMLVHFEDHYPEGDDRPPTVVWAGPTQESVDTQSPEDVLKDAINDAMLQEVGFYRPNQAVVSRPSPPDGDPKLYLEPLPAYVEYLKNPRGE